MTTTWPTRTLTSADASEAAALVIAHTTHDTPKMAQTSITEDSLRAALTERLKATHVEVQDMSGGCGQSFTTLVVSPEFAGKNSLKRHRLVNAALKDEIAQIHAWSAKCQTPDEYDKEMAATGGKDGPPLDGTEGGKVTGVSE